MSVTSAESIDEDQQITFSTIKCGEIFHTPDRQFFLLNCGVCGKGFCALNEFIEHVNHASCSALPLTSTTIDEGIVSKVVLPVEYGCVDAVAIEDRQIRVNDDGDDAFQELIEYTNDDVVSSGIEGMIESSDESYLLPEIGCLFQEVEQHLNGEDAIADHHPLTNAAEAPTDVVRHAKNPRRSLEDEFTENDPITIRIIELYKSNECLWSKGHPDFHNREERNDVYQTITNSLQEEFQYSLTIQELNYKLNRLRYAFYRELRKMKTFQSNSNNSSEKFKSSLWYFDLLTFLKCNTSVFLEVPKSQILLDMIDGYHRCQCLWDRSHHDFRNRRVRYAAYDAIATTIEIKYSIRTTRRSVILQIKKLQALYSQSLRSEGAMQADNEESTPLKELLLKKLSFLKGNIRGCKEIHCNLCDEVFYSNIKYKLHHQKHTGNRPYSCSTCNKQFLHRPSLKAHENTHLDVNDRAFTCEYCGMKIADRTNYKVHVQRHKGEQQYECKVCKKRLATSTELRNHMLDHTGEKPNICEQCGNQYKSRSELMRHLRLHSSRKEFKCGYCVKAFHIKSQLDQHMLTHFSQPCDICGLEINGRRAFIRHKKEHSV